MSHLPMMPVLDRSGFAPVVGNAVSMIGMLVLVGTSLVHMMA